MAVTCGVCGKAHEGLPKFFMWKLPEYALDSSTPFIEDSKSMGRVGDERHFVRCEVEVPIAPDRTEVLGFICWVEVSADVYAALLAYRAAEDDAAPYESLVDGRLANPVPCIAGSLGTAVGFQVLKNDPTPYIRWVEPGSAVERLIDSGASQSYWHEAAARMGWRPDA